MDSFPHQSLGVFNDMDDVKGILLWVGLLAIFAIVFFLSQRMKKQIEENGIETTGVISRIVDFGSSDEINLQYYVRYRTEDGKEIEGVLSNPGKDLQEGQEVRIKYHPKFKNNARLINEKHN